MKSSTFRKALSTTVKGITNVGNAAVAASKAGDFYKNQVNTVKHLSTSSLIFTPRKFIDAFKGNMPKIFSRTINAATRLMNSKVDQVVSSARKFSKFFLEWHLEVEDFVAKLTKI